MHFAGQKICGQSHGHSIIEHQMSRNPTMRTTGNLLFAVLQSQGVQKLLTRRTKTDQTAALLKARLITPIPISDQFFDARRTAMNPFQHLPLFQQVEVSMEPEFSL